VQLHQHLSTIHKPCQPHGFVFAEPPLHLRVGMGIKGWTVCTEGLNITGRLMVAVLSCLAACRLRPVVQRLLMCTVLCACIVCSSCVWVSELPVQPCVHMFVYCLMIRDGAYSGLQQLLQGWFSAVVEWCLQFRVIGTKNSSAISGRFTQCGMAALFQSVNQQTGCMVLESSFYSVGFTQDSLEEAMPTGTRAAS
jgi:hypothetical protein